ncbi:MAG: hypothetical protein ISS71_07420 [Phycisphaerae bacterium]|nr:hypothetical protein [Phycisphaerae bacterium]
MDVFNDGIMERVARYSLFLLVGSVLCFSSGCHEQALSPEPQAAMKTPGAFADYVRNEPAVRDVQLWDNPYGPGLVIQTKHYRVYTTLLEPLMLRQVPGFIESAFKAYESQLPRPRLARQLMDVYLFGTRGQWEDFTKSFTGAESAMYLQIKKGAYVANGTCVAYNIGRKQTFSVIGHEGWHQYNQHLFTYRLPSWLDEGIATLFETCRYTQGQFVFEPGKNLMRLGSLKETMQKGGFIPLHQLILLNPGQVLTGGYGDTDDAVIAFYAQNYALVRFLREQNYGIRLRKYHALLLGAAEGTWPLQGDWATMAADRRQRLTARWNSQVSGALFDYYINEDIQKLDAEYREFCAKIVYHIRLKK